MKAEPRSPYTVVGAGAIGGTLAHHLARAGHPVTVVDADQEHIRAIAVDGITLVRGDTLSSVPVQSAVTPQEGPDSVGRVLLAVKAQATDRALDWVVPRLSPGGFVVSLQNGLNEDAIAARVGAERTVGAFVNLFADVIGPGQIRDGGLGALVVGEMDGSTSARVRSVVEDLQAWGPGTSHHQRFRLPVVQAGLRRDADRHRARRCPDGGPDRRPPSADVPVDCRGPRRG